MSKNFVIFDFDGTLVDSLSLSMRVSNSLAPLFGYRQVTEDEVPALKKLALPELFKAVGVPLHSLPLLFARARKEIAAEINAVKVFEGIETVLEELKNSNLRLGVVTSNSTANVKACLEKNNVLDKFDFVHSAKNLFGKHRTLARLMKRRGMERKHVLYVGDEVRDIVASHRIHIPIAAVTWGFQAREKLESMKPEFLVDSPADLVKVASRVFAGPQPG